MAYNKPVIVAQNSAQGAYAAGCGANNPSGSSMCKNCERTV
jgi:hypothetical protein